MWLDCVIYTHMCVIYKATKAGDDNELEGLVSAYRHMALHMEDVLESRWADCRENFNTG